MAGSMGKRDWVTVIGGGLVFSALIFGGGLLMLGSSDASTHAHADKSDAHAHDKKDAGHGDTADHGKTKDDGHGHDSKEEKKPDPSEPYEAPFITETTELGGAAAKKAEEHGQDHGHDDATHESKDGPKAVKDQPSLRGSHIADGDAALARGQADDAYMQYRKAFQARDPRVPVAKTLLRMAQASLQSETLGLQSRSTRALQYYSQILNDHPHSPYADDALYETGYCYLRGGAPEKAHEAFEHYLKTFPEGEHRIDVQLGLIDLRLAEDRPDKALALLKTLKTDASLSEVHTSRVLLREAETNLKLSRLTHARRRVLRAEERIENGGKSKDEGQSEIKHKAADDPQKHALTPVIEKKADAAAVHVDVHAGKEGH